MVRLPSNRARKVGAVRISQHLSCLLKVEFNSKPLQRSTQPASSFKVKFSSQTKTFWFKWNKKSSSFFKIFPWSNAFIRIHFLNLSPYFSDILLVYLLLEMWRSGILILTTGFWDHIWNSRTCLEDTWGKDEPFHTLSILKGPSYSALPSSRQPWKKLHEECCQM